MKTVWIYIAASRKVGDSILIKVFANRIAARMWFARHDPKGVAFEYEVLE
jgi:uncharacterized SAM-dependent methyltransferase